jgi:hypothetical protein
MTTDINMNGVRSWRDRADLALIALRGVGQVMFQDHAGTGLLFLIGIAWASPLMGVGAAIGAIIGPAVAFLMRFDRKEIEAGIHGFNPVLVGAGLMAFLQPVALTWVFVVVGCVAATFVCYLARRYLKFPTYTAPFVVTTWLLIAVAHAIAGTEIDLVSAPVVETPIGFFQGLLLKGVAQVFFMGDVVTGILPGHKDLHRYLWLQCLACSNGRVPVEEITFAFDSRCRDSDPDDGGFPRLVGYSRADGPLRHGDLDCARCRSTRSRLRGRANARMTRRFLRH